MYDLKFEDKVRVWKDLRETIEVSSKPFNLLSQFIKSLPRSSRKENPWDPRSVAEPVSYTHLTLPTNREV